MILSQTTTFYHWKVKKKTQSVHRWLHRLNMDSWPVLVSNWYLFLLNRVKNYGNLTNVDHAIHRLTANWLTSWLGDWGEQQQSSRWTRRRAKKCKYKKIKITRPQTMAFFIVFSCLIMTGVKAQTMGQTAHITDCSMCFWHCHQVTVQFQHVDGVLHSSV